MIKFLYQATILLSKILGIWIFITVSRLIAAGYFFFLPLRVKVSLQFYRALFPRKNRFFHLGCVWKQYQEFSRLFLDRFILLDADKITYSSKGWEHLEDLLRENRGGIILMSHMGNWEVAAHLLKRRKNNLDFMIYMGAKQKEQLEKLQKESLIKSRIKIIAVEPNSGTPYHLIEAHNFIKKGGLVSLPGDMVWHDAQRTVPVKFLDHEVHLPAAPHRLALSSDKPLLVLFSFRTGKNHYTIEICQPIKIKAGARADRDEAVRKSAQEYAALLEQALRKHPFEWFHFKPFLDTKH